MHSVRRAAAVSLVGLLLLTSCQGSVDTSDSTAPVETASTAPTPVPTATEVPAPLPAATGATTQAEADAVLAQLGLQVQRSVELPGTDEVALVVGVTGANAVDTWQQVRSLVPQLGRYPVVVGGYQESSELPIPPIEGILEFAELDESVPQQVLDAAASIDPSEWFVERAEYLSIPESELAGSGALPTIGWSRQVFNFPLDILTGETLGPLDLVLLPTTKSWEATAFLAWGGWNDVPFAAEHVALHRYWFEQHQAEIVSITSDSIEMTVGVPPQSDDETRAIASQLFLYAPDTVWQGTGDVDSLAASIQDAPIWYFWWD